MYPDLIAYNLPLVIRFSGYLKRGLLGDSINAIVSRHEILRTTYIEIDGSPIQVVNPPSPIEIKFIDLTQSSENEREFHHAIWVLSGFVIRDELQSSNPTIEAVRDRIRNTSVFVSLTSKQKRRVLKGIRISKGIKERAKAAGFGSTTIKLMNQYLSSHVHSDGLSAVHNIDADTSKKQLENIDMNMNLLMMIMAKMILEYKRLFPSVEELCKENHESIKLAEKWSRIASNLS